MTVAEAMYKENNPDSQLRVFQLCNNGQVDFEIHIHENNKSSISGRIMEVTAWMSDSRGNYEIPDDYNFIADFYIKWDMCSHFWFKGQDSDFSLEDADDCCDSYYHICGSYSYINFFRAIAFATEVAAILMPDSSEIPEEIEKIRKFKLLEGFEIKEVK